MKENLKRILIVICTFIVINGIVCVFVSNYYDNTYIYLSLLAFLILMLASFVILPILLLLEHDL